MYALELASPVATPDYNSSPSMMSQEKIMDEVEKVIVKHERFRYVLYESEVASMAPSTRMKADNPLLYTDCVVTSTLADSFHNIISIAPKNATIQMTMDGAKSQRQWYPHTRVKRRNMFTIGYVFEFELHCFLLFSLSAWNFKVQTLRYISKLGCTN